MKKLVFLMVLVFVMTACSHASDIPEPDVNEKGLSFIDYVKKNSGQVEVDNDLRRAFNDFAREYKLIYLPEVNMYESFFERDNYAGDSDFLNFAGAVFYTIHLNLDMGEFSEEFMQSEMQSLFLAEDAYENMPHQAYPKFARYENGKYTPWPEGMRDPNREFYLLTSLEIETEGDNKRAIFEYENYYFNDTEVYEPEDKEIWLLEKAEELDLDPLETAHYLTVTGQIEELESKHSYHTEIKVCVEDECEYGFKYAVNFIAE